MIVLQAVIHFITAIIIRAGYRAINSGPQICLPHRAIFCLLRVLRPLMLTTTPTRVLRKLTNEHNPTLPLGYGIHHARSTSPKRCAHKAVLYINPGHKPCRQQSLRRICAISVDVAKRSNVVSQAYDIRPRIPNRPTYRTDRIDIVLCCC